jgi:hypothetical protein
LSTGLGVDFEWLEKPTLIGEKCGFLQTRPKDKIKRTSTATAAGEGARPTFF